MGHAESGIQNYCTQRLELLERTSPVYFFRSNSFTGRVMRYNGSTGFIKNSKVGLPDVVAVIKGKFVGFEFKSEKGRQSPEQKIAEQSIIGCGGEYFLIRTPEEFEESLKKLLHA